MKAADRALLMEIPDYAKGDQDLWTPKLVKMALVDSFRMLRRSGDRVGPRGDKAFWPDMEPGEYQEPKTPTHYNTPMTVTRMEMVLCGWKGQDGRQHAAWLAGGLLSVPEYREKLVAWVQAELRGESSTSLSERKGWSLATFKRHRDRAAGLVARRLNESKLQVW